MDEETFEQKFEAAIPILVLLLLIIGIIALNPGILGGIPLVGHYFEGKAVHVLVITDDMNEVNVWQGILSNDMSRRIFGNPVNVEGMMGSQTANILTSKGALDQKGYDLIILTSKHIPVGVQLVLRDWVNSGGKLYVTSTGGINNDGRWGELAGLIPVQCGANGICSDIIKPVYGATVYINDFENPLAKKFNNGTPLTSGNSSINVAMVSPKETGWIMYLGGWDSADEVQAGKVGNIYPFITESSQLTGGRVFYMAFDPAVENLAMDMKQKIIINTIAYIMGVEGYTE